MLADKIGKEKVLTLGFSIFVLSLMLMVLLDSNHAYIIAAIFGLYIGTMETVQRAVVPVYVAPEMQGTAFGLYYMVIGLSFFVCNTIFGLLWDTFNFDIAAIYSTILSVGAIVAMLFFMRRGKLVKVL